MHKQKTVLRKKISVPLSTEPENPRRIIVIMAGGRGERFWPQSRTARPKHLLPIVGDETLLNQTVKRLENIVPLEDIFIITNALQENAVRESCTSIRKENIIIEPVGRDTGAAVALAGVIAKRVHAGATLALLPADHVIKDKLGFKKTIEAAFEAAESGDYLVTVSIPPTHPETGFGYIERGTVHNDSGKAPVYNVKRFVEKPELKKAKEYVKAGTFYWNGGMFVWSVKSIENALKLHAPELHKCFTKLEKDLEGDKSFQDVITRHYGSLPKLSIDYAVMEKAKNVLTVPALFDWDDVGSWTALMRHFPHDKNGNVVRGNAIVEAGKNNIVMSNGGHLVTVLGVEGLVVVHTKDATLVCTMEKAQEIKTLLKRIAEHPEGKSTL